jgi:hypothetical protein
VSTIPDDDYNATFHSFRANGKWYSTGRGNIPFELYKYPKTPDKRKLICQHNGGMYPGTHPELGSSWNSELTFVVIPDVILSHVPPVMLLPGDMS